MTNKPPEVSGDVDERDWPKELDRALEKNRQLDDQIVREREESATRIGALLAKLGGQATITKAELDASVGCFTEYLPDGSLKLSTR